MTDKTTKSEFNLRKIAPLGLIVVIAIIGVVYLKDYLSFESLRENRDALIAWRDSNFILSVFVFMVGYVTIVAFSLPGAAIGTLTGGFLFGVFPGFLFNISAATIGAILIFLAARNGLGDYLAKKMDESGGAAKTFKAGLKENELSYLLIMRLVPAVPFFVANLIPALVGVSLGRFALTTFFGIIPGGVVYTWVGAGLGDVFARGESPNLGIIFEPQILGPILALSALAALPVILKLFKKKAG